MDEELEKKKQELNNINKSFSDEIVQETQTNSGDVKALQINELLKGIGRNDNEEIDESQLQEENEEMDVFEKMYIFTSASSNSQEMAGKNKTPLIREEDLPENGYDSISTFSEYKEEHQRLLEEENRGKNLNDSNYYIIPQTIRKGENVTSRIDVVVDALGNNLYVIMENGKVFPTNQLLKEISEATERYSEEINSGRIAPNEIESLFLFEDVDSLSAAIKDNSLNLEDVQEKVDDYVEDLGIEKKPVSYKRMPEPSVTYKGTENETKENRDIAKDEKEAEEKKEEQEEDKAQEEESMVGSQEELEEEEKDKDKKDSELTTISERLSKKLGCKAWQIDYRWIQDYQKLKEDTGLHITEGEKGDILAVRVNYQYRQNKYYILNAKTGELLQNRREISDGNIPEVQDYFWRKNRKGENVARPLRNDEGRSYITEVEQDGGIKERKFVNNGKEDDMLREERERYIADVNEANKELSDAIQSYEKSGTREDWTKVQDAMKRRVEVDMKYHIKERGLEEQKDATIDTLENIRRKDKEREKEDDDERYLGDGRGRW